MAAIDLTSENFEQTINDNEIILLDFWATWCAPCRQFAPTFEKVSEKYTDIVFGKINTEEEQELAGNFQIRSIPTLMIFRENIVIFQQPGSLPEDGLIEVIEKAKSLDMDMVREQIKNQPKS